MVLVTRESRQRRWRDDRVTRLDHCVIAVCDWPAPTRSIGTCLHVYFRDPDGSLLELVSYAP
jgi:catechol 2,3-dioxygenase-like lactoylglutathione lyase family enzyme